MKNPEIRWNYFYAKKDKRYVCVKCTDKWLERATNYLFDNGFTLSPALELNWNMKKDGLGVPVTCFQLDSNTKDFLVS